MNLADILPGFLATVGDAGDEVGHDPLVEVRTCGGDEAPRLHLWGVSPVPGPHLAVVLSRVVRNADGAVSSSEVADRLRTDPASLTGLLPPFAAVGTDDRSCTMVADSMGFRPLYHTASGSDPAGMSTSGLALARALRAPLDVEALAVQAHLGWQLRQRTVHAGVQKLEPGGVATLVGRELVLHGPDPVALPETSLSDAVREAAALLRQSLSHILDEYPDAVLQLTGGQDSRLLLSAVDPARRRGLRAMTLGDPTSGDVTIAASIAARYGLDHQVRQASLPSDLTPADAWALTTRCARRLDAAADPLALAALTLAEAHFEQGTRISGLGGEVARGFYYVGPVNDDAPVTRTRSLHLADWRMLVNEAVEPDLLASDFRTWSREFARSDIHDILTETRQGWFRATDDLYLRHRMQRWAGLTDTAVGVERLILNPMLDAGFLTVADRLAPRDKASSRFLAALQMELDPTLGRIRMEGRPPPATYAAPRPWHAPMRAEALGRKVWAKLWQRYQRRSRPALGTERLATLVVDHWRQHPHSLTSAVATGLLDQAWVTRVLEGRHQPTPSSVAFLTNLSVASSLVGSDG